MCEVLESVFDFKGLRAVDFQNQKTFKKADLKIKLV